MKQAVEYVADLTLPGIGTIMFAGELKWKSRQPMISFEIAGNRVDFRMDGEMDGGWSKISDERVYTRRVQYKPVFRRESVENKD